MVMGVLKVEKCLRFVIASFLIFIMWLILHQSNHSPYPSYVKSWLFTPQPPAYSSKSKSILLQVLRRATMEDRTIVLTVVNKAWATSGSVLDLFLESFQIGQATKPLLNHIVIATLDKQAFRYCNSIHPNCFLLKNSSPNQTNRKIQSKNPDHPTFGAGIINLLKQVLELGYNVVFTEADVMWLRNPFPHLDPEKEIEVTCDFSTANQPNIETRADAGFFHAKSFDSTLEIFKMVKLMRFLFPDYEHKSFCEILEYTGIETKLGHRLNHLNLTNFVGFCNPEVKLSKISTFHANCCENTKSKVHELKLLLDDWKKVAAAGFQWEISSWKAPTKCIE